MKYTVKNKKTLVGFLTVAVIIGTALSALAVGSYLSQFNAQYGTTGTNLDTCLICHGAGGPPNNPYGADYAANGYNFASIEQLDSDGDGYTNLEEITAGTFPGDASDFPGTTPPPPPPPPSDISCIPAEGTIGTEVVCTGPDFGTDKGKVVVGTAFAKIAKGGWTNTTISATIAKVLPAGPYDLALYSKPYNAAPPVILPSSFTVMNPEVVSLSQSSASPGSEIIVTGRFFGTKKGKVYIEGLSKGNPKRKNGKITYWFMNPTTGESELRFLVPKGLDQGTYPMTLMNKIGAAETTFTVNP
jgi:hypothetical protein